MAGIDIAVVNIVYLPFIFPKASLIIVDSLLFLQDRGPFFFVHKFQQDEEFIVIMQLGQAI